MGLSAKEITERTSADPRWVAIHEDGSPFPGPEHPTQVALRTGREVRDVVIGLWNPKLNQHRWIRATATPQFRPGEAAPHSAYVVIEDITESRRAAEQIRMLAELVDAAPSSITVHDYDGRFLFANEHTLALHGYSKEELLALNLHELDVPESEQRIEERMELLRRHGRASFEARHRRKDGSEIPLLVTIKRLRWGNRDVILSNALDLSEYKAQEERQRELERRLMQVQRRQVLGDLAGGVAHDFNNLLMAVLGNLDLALQDVPAISPAIEPMQDAIRAARRAAQLSMQMAMYTGHTVLRTEEFDLSSLVEESVPLLRSTLPEGANLDVRVRAESTSICGDRGQLRQLLVNLVTNAAEAARQAARHGHAGNRCR